MRPVLATSHARIHMHSSTVAPKLVNRLYAALILTCLVTPIPARDVEPKQKTSVATNAGRRYTLESLAGEYSFGNGLDLNYDLHIVGDGQFTYQQASYEGVQAEAAGRVALRGNRLVLTPETATPEAWPNGMGLELVPVAWGDRQYLVPQKDMMAFINACNRGSEPVQQISRGQFFLREGDLDKPAPGRPDVPKAFAGLLLTKPVTGRVLSSDESGRWKVNVGRASGLQPGMELCASSPGNEDCVTVCVCVVQDDCCIVETRKAPTTPLVNWKVCTRQHSE